MDQVDSSSSLAPFHVRNHHLIPVLSSCVAFGKLNHNVKFKKPDMKERFECWIVVNGKTYRDEEEKAMWFELFKAALENVELQLLPVEESGVLPGVSCCADFTPEEIRNLLAFPNGIDETGYDEIVKSVWAKQ
ncbi:hypothetical protein D1007_13989 [Hordeum vulgare]|nr:hypothetical protein D1007_13989 [Hordeum vulgare]